MIPCYDDISFSYTFQYTAQGQAGDWTMPATLWPNGTWVNPLPGASY